MNNNLKEGVKTFSYKNTMKIKRSNFWVRRFVHFDNNIVRYYKSQKEKDPRLELDLKKYYVQVQINRNDTQPLMLVSDDKQNYALKLYFNSETECNAVVEGISPYVKRVDVVDLRKSDKRKKTDAERNRSLSKINNKTMFDENKERSEKTVVSQSDIVMKEDMFDSEREV